MDPRFILLGALGVFTLFYIGVFITGLKKAKEETGVAPTPTGAGLATGFVTNFFDTLGIGSFATTTAIFRFLKMVPDEKIPGTLNIGHTLPTIAQAFIYTTVIDVDFKTLVLLITAAIVGSWLGAGVVSNWPRRKIQLGMGGALAAGAVFYAIKSLDEMRATPVFPGGEALGLDGTLLIVAILGNATLGALMTLGIGLYAPCMIMIALLGMQPSAAFPIMMGSCAFLMPVSSARFVKEKKFDPKAVVGLALGGIPAVLIAALIVKSLPLTWIRWLVVVVVLYAGVGLLRSAFKESKVTSPGAGGAAKA